MIRSLHFREFKGLRDFRISLRQTNVLVGPNNSGKSSVLDALRILAAAVRFARRRNPSHIAVPGGASIYGWDIPISSIPVTLTNVHWNSDHDVEASIVIEFEDRSLLELKFLEGSRCLLRASADDLPPITSAARFRSRYPVKLYSFPTLGPLEEDEEYRNDEYVERSRTTRRSHRIFRNIWFRQPELFSQFKGMVETSWPGVIVSPPTRYGFAPARLEMFYDEGHRDREISWAGFGFQVWLQLITHVVSTSDSTTLIVDEPEIYLHPDLQRKLFDLLRTLGKQIVLATHSAEIVNDAERDEVVIVNRERRHARRISDVDGLQEALFAIGSAQNIHLTKLSRGRRVLFLEGLEFRILRRLAGKLELGSIASGADLTVVPIGGFSQRQRIQEAAWTFGQVLKADISIAALLDRDYRPDEEISEIIAGMRSTVPDFFVLGSKEIENYLLSPAAITRAVGSRIRESKKPDLREPSEAEIVEIIEEVAEDLKSEVQAQLIAHRVRFFAKSGKDSSTLVKEAMADLEGRWKTLSGRLMIIPGKTAMTAINRKLTEQFGVSITSAQIIAQMRITEISQDLREILVALETFSERSG